LDARSRRPIGPPLNNKMTGEVIDLPVGVTRGQSREGGRNSAGSVIQVSLAIREADRGHDLKYWVD
jgi:hypothetical protein